MRRTIARCAIATGRSVARVVVVLVVAVLVLVAELFVDHLADLGGDGATSSALELADLAVALGREKHAACSAGEHGAKASLTGGQRVAMLVVLYLLLLAGLAGLAGLLLSVGRRRVAAVVGSLVIVGRGGSMRARCGRGGRDATHGTAVVASVGRARVVVVRSARERRSRAARIGRLRTTGI